MKAILPVFCVATAALLGCSDSSSNSGSGQQTNAESAGTPFSAPVDYVGSLGNAKHKAVKTVDVASLTRAVQMFQVSEGRLPKDLDELVTLEYMSKLPDAPYGQKLDYNPTTGEVTVVPVQ